MRRRGEIVRLTVGRLGELSCRIVILRVGCHPMASWQHHHSIGLLIHHSNHQSKIISKKKVRKKK